MWQLRGTTASLETDRLTGTIDLLQPQLGLHALQTTIGDRPGPPSPTRLMCFSLHGEPNCGSGPAQRKRDVHSLREIRESWVRGGDLIAVYGPASASASQSVIYWRSLSCSDGVGIELIVSIQTALLDDVPATYVVSEMPAQETWWLPSGALPESARRLNSGSAAHRTDGPGSCVVRWGERASYIEMVHPGDFCGTELCWDQKQVTITSPLFPERLEKGVIRRGRLRGWLVPSAGDLAAAAQMYQDFAKSEPPLTT